MSDGIRDLSKNSLIMQWNKDVNGNPTSIHIQSEMQQVSTTNSMIQLAQIPDEYMKLNIGTDGIWLKEVYSRDEIEKDSFFVDYGVGLVYFHSDMQGRDVICNYYGKGVILISDSRIFHKDGNTFVDTWDNIIDKSKDALELLQASGGLSGAIDTINRKINEGTKVADRIEDFIEETEFYGYTILLTREAFTIKAREDGNVDAVNYGTIFTDVIVYRGAQQITNLEITLTDQRNCEFEVVGQRIRLKTGSLDVNSIKGQATVNIDCGDGLVAQRIIEVTKIFDGVSQYQVELMNSLYSFSANSDGRIEEPQSVTCDISILKAYETYEDYTVTIQNMPKGLTHDIANGTKVNSVTFTAEVGEILPNNGSVIVSVQTKDGIVINKTFSYGKVKQGYDAKSLILTGNQLVRYETPDYSGIPSPMRSTIHLQANGLSGTPRWYVLNNNVWELIVGESGQTLEVYHDNKIVWGDRKETTIRCELDGYSDEITLIKIANGATGSDAYSIILSNESTTVPSDEFGIVPTNEAQKQTTTITVYHGANVIQPNSIEVVESVGNIYGATVKDNVVRLQHIATTEDSVNIPIAITVGELVFYRSWNIAKSKRGQGGKDGVNGADGVDGVNGSTFILNVEGGTRSIVYNQMNTNPRPSTSAQFIARLYENGMEVLDGVSYYWTCLGHVSGTSATHMFTPIFSSTYDEGIQSNQITVTASYKGNYISYTVPIAITKDVGGIDWVVDWDSTKVSIRDTEVLTPKIFAGTYNQASDSVTGVAIGQDVLNDGQTIGIVAYQDNTPTLLVGTDGSIEIGDPYQNRSVDGVGVGYNNGEFVGKFSKLSISGVDVPTQEDVNNKVNEVVSDVQTKLDNEVSEMNDSLNNLNNYLNEAFRDGILNEVELGKLESLMAMIRQEVSDMEGQYSSIRNNKYLTNESIVESLYLAYGDYQFSYQEVERKYRVITGMGDGGELVETDPSIEENEEGVPPATDDEIYGEGSLGNDETIDTGGIQRFTLDQLKYVSSPRVAEEDVEGFLQATNEFRVSSNNLYQVLSLAITSISETQATQMAEQAKEEVMKEVGDISDALTGLENTMNNEFKTGIIGSLNRANLEERLRQLDIEKKDVDGQYDSILNNSALSNSSRTTLLNAKNELDKAHDTLVLKINTVISDGLMTEAELQQVNTLIATYAVKLGEYSKVAQEANADIIKNTTQQAIEAISDEDVFNKVTNFGKTQGLFIESNGKVYINAQYIQTRGFVATKDDGAKTFEIDKDGNVNIVVNSFTLTSNATTNVATKDYVDASISNVEFDETDLTQEGVFNALTNNGQTQGIYLQEGNLHVNGEYVNTRNLKAVKNDGTETFKIDSEGNVSIQAKSFILTGDATTNVATTDYVNDAVSQVSNGAINIVLSNEAQVISTNANSVPLASQSFVIKVQMFKATNEVTDFAIGAMPSANGITASVSQSTKTITFSVSTSTTINAVSGKFTIPITYDGRTYSKDWSWAIAKQGNTGASGSDGSDAKYVTIVGEQVFKYTNNFVGAPTPTSITLTANVYNTTSTGKWQYLNGGAWTDCNVTAKTLTLQPTSYTLSSLKRATVRYIVDDVYDTFTVVAVSDGARGEDGTNGIDGVDGTSSYFYVRYSANSNGSSMTTTPTSESRYMGVCSTTSTTAPTDYTKYTWTLIKGADGQDGSVGAKGEDGRTSYLHIKYSNDGKTFTSNNGEDVGLYIGTYVDFNQADSTVFSDYTWKKFVGEDGQDGTDAITIVLSNENHTFSANSSGNITATQVTTTSITAYKGASTTSVTIGTLPTVTGLTLSKSGSTVTIQANTGTSLADTGTFSIPLTIDGKSFTKNFSWTKVKAGATGSAGANAKAVDIIASSQVFKSTDGGATFSPSTITLTPKLQNLTYSNWQYSTNGGSSWTTVSSGSNGLTISGGVLTISKDSALYTSSVTSISFRVNTNDSAYYDITTIVKLYDVADVDFDQIAQDKVDEYDKSLNQLKVFNKLTNNGQTQGIYLEDSKLYINGEYIKAGTIRADLVKVAVEGKENILPFNYVTLKSGIESWLNIDETNEGIPYAEMDMPIYQGGGSNSYFCRKLGSSTVILEPNTRYFFSCDIYADVPRDGVETYGVGGSTGTGAELTLMTAMNERYVTEGRYVPILVIDSLALKTVDGQWTHITYEFTTPAESELYSLSNHMYIELNGSNYNTGSYGYIRIANMALEKATEGQATASTFDYLTQLKERRIDLTDDKFYHTRLSIDGFSTEEGIIEGVTSTDGHDYLLNYDGLSVSKSPRERYFVGKDKSYYSYEAGSSGIISGHNDIYGVGGVHRNPSDEYAGYRGIFAGVHYGFQIPNSTAFGRPDIYVHNGEWGLDFEEWQLLGDIIEPRGLVRRDDSKNITTNHQLKFLAGGGTDTANVWNQEQYNTTGNGQMLTYSAGRVFVSNPQTPLVLESSTTPSVKIGSDVEHQIFHTGYVPKSGNWWNGGAVRVSGDGVAEVGRYIDFHNSNSSTSDYDMRLSVENDGGMRCTGSIRTGGGFDCNGGYWINGYQCVARATHGGFDFGHTGANTAILSANVPTWWNGSVSHTIYTSGNKPSVIDPKGVMSNAEYGRNVYDSGIYTYNLHNNSLINGDSSWSAYAGYWSVLSWGRGTAGSAQLAIDWTSGGKGFYMRSLRDTSDNWWTWKRIPNDQWTQTSTSDIRYKEVMSDVDLDDCYNMVKNIGLHSYLLLDEEDKHTEGFDPEVAFLKATQEEGISRKLQMGVIAQEMLEYKCSDFIVVQDILKGREGEILSDKYSIDAYNYASAILGGLQKEIQIRDEQYEELKQENEELKAKVDSLEQRLAKLEALLLGQE